jgi:hypothetical protein
MIIFGGVDGTGVWNNREYAEIFEHSFVATLCRSWTVGPRNYVRGPVTADNKPVDSTYLAAVQTYRHVLSHWKTGESAVFLAGYSRGGAAVIEVAKWLRDKEIPVECLILFDPVDRTGQVGSPLRNTPIVDTVKTVIYAKRSPAAKSRESFGNCGLTMWNGQPTPYREFFATHGGLGGVPWSQPKAGGFINEGPPDGETRITVQMDRHGATAVQRWTFNLVMDALHECRERLAKPDNPGKQPGVNAGRPGHEPKIHIVRPGDWLSKIALTYYGDMNKWRVIYDHPQNRRTIGPNYNLIKPGQSLVIP